MASSSRFKRWRAKQNLTQEQIARMTGYSARQVYNWDRGQIPPARALPAIAAALGAGIEDLFGAVDMRGRAA